MNTPTVCSFLVLALLASPARAGLHPEPKRAFRDAAGPRARGWSFDVRLGAFAGAFQGDGVRTDSGGLALVESKLTPILREGAWKLEVPLQLGHLQTIGASLAETRAAAGASVDWHPLKLLHVGPEAGVSFAWRPSWPDLYQRQADGTLPLTDRYSFFSWHAGAAASLSPVSHHHARLRYRYVSYRYRRDPSFQPDLDPMHLTPLDRDTHELLASWRVAYERFAGALRAEYQHRQDKVLLARNAGTGSTSGYSNPLQRLDLFEPSIELDGRRLGGRLDVSLAYGYLVQIDPFQGYYSYTGHHPRLQLDCAIVETLRARARAEAWILEYGPQSTSPSRLASGTRRYDRRLILSAGLAYGLTERLVASLDGRWVKRDTNYADYTPGVNPASRFYDIRWSYSNFEVLAGIEYAR